MPLEKWTTIVLPKSKGGWGIKNPELFCKALEEIVLWRMVENLESMWVRTMRIKYCQQASIKEWFKNPEKTHKDGSIGWKGFIIAFPFVGNWVAWKIGNERNIKGGKDP